MSFHRNLILLLSFVMITGGADHAYAEKATASAGAGQGLFCEGMSDHSLYDKYKFDSYKLLVPGKDDWIFRSQSDFKTDFTLPRETLNKLEEIDRAMAKKGTRLIMLMTPTRPMMHSEIIKESDLTKYNFNADAVWKSYQAFLESLRKRGIETVGIKRIPPGSSFFYHMDHHWNPDGARIAANAVAGHIKGLPEYSSIPKMNFATQERGNYEFEGVSKKVFKKICNTTQSAETIIKYSTDQTGQSSAESDLFGETAIPDIVLLGTSNSTMEPSNANFEGFLKEALSADVLNMSVSGGGLDTAMLTYFASDYYRDHPSKIAVWEVPSYYDIQNHDAFLREAVAGAYGSCKGREEAAVENIPINEEMVYTLEKLIPKKITGDDYYIEIAFSEAMPTSFSVNFRYKDNKDRYKFIHTGRAGSGKNFFLELNPEKKEVLDKVILSVPTEMRGKTVSVRLCEK